MRLLEERVAAKRCLRTPTSQSGPSNEALRGVAPSEAARADERAELSDERPELSDDSPPSERAELGILGSVPKSAEFLRNVDRSIW